MAYSAHTDEEVNANSPITDTLWAKSKNNQQAHEDRLNAASGNKNSIPFDGLKLPIKLPYQEVTGSLTLGSTHGVVVADMSGGAITVTLPAAASNARVIYAIGQKGNTPNLIISRSGSDKLVDVAQPAGQDEIVLTDGQIISLISDGVSRWRKLWDSRV